MQEQPIDLEKRRSEREFKRHWSLVRRFLAEAHHVDVMPPRAAAALERVGEDYRVYLACGLTDQEAQVAADQCALYAWSSVEFKAIRLSDIREVLGYGGWDETAMRVGLRG
jgi:hypothetical protein